jgi:hypothetical protein
MAKPTTSTLASQALDELARSVENRADHEMRNNEVYGDDIEASLQTELCDMAYEHKPIHARSPDGHIPGSHMGGQHAHSVSVGGGHGTKGQFARKAGPKPKGAGGKGKKSAY